MRTGDMRKEEGKPGGKKGGREIGQQRMLKSAEFLFSSGLRKRLNEEGYLCKRMAFCLGLFTTRRAV
jgi:hypothetical protein